MKLDGMRGCPAGTWGQFVMNWSSTEHYYLMHMPASSAALPVAPIDHLYGTLELVHATSTQRYSEMAGMREELEGRGSFTMFAPSDDAWAELDPVSSLVPNAATLTGPRSSPLVVPSEHARFTGEQRQHRPAQRSSLPYGEPPFPHQRPEERHKHCFHVQQAGPLHQPLLQWGPFSHKNETMFCFFFEIASVWRPKILLPLKVVTVNCARIIHANQVATNGVVHVIDRVIRVVGKTIKDVLNENEELSSFSVCRRNKSVSIATGLRLINRLKIKLL